MRETASPTPPRRVTFAAFPPPDAAPPHRVVTPRFPFGGRSLPLDLGDEKVADDSLRPSSRILPCAGGSVMGPVPQPSLLGAGRIQALQRRLANHHHLPCRRLTEVCAQTTSLLILIADRGKMVVHFGVLNQLILRQQDLLRDELISFQHHSDVVALGGRATGREMLFMEFKGREMDVEQDAQVHDQARPWEGCRLPPSISASLGDALAPSPPPPSVDDDDLSPILEALRLLDDADIDVDSLDDMLDEDIDAPRSGDLEDGGAYLV
jgi:hypothetical protein